MKTVIRFVALLSLTWIVSACGDDPVEAAPGVPVAVELVSQTPGTAPAGGRIDLRARVRDSAGAGVAGVEVEFEVIEGDGTLSAPSPQSSATRAVVLTNPQGEATASWTLGQMLGEQALSVRGRNEEAQVFSQLSVVVTAVSPN